MGGLHVDGGEARLLRQLRRFHELVFQTLQLRRRRSEEDRADVPVFRSTSGLCTATMRFGQENRPECVNCTGNSRSLSSPQVSRWVWWIIFTRRAISTTLPSWIHNCRGLARPSRATAVASNQMSLAPPRANRSYRRQVSPTACRRHRHRSLPSGGWRWRFPRRRRRR